MKSARTLNLIGKSVILDNDNFVYKIKRRNKYDWNVQCKEEDCGAEGKFFTENSTLSKVVHLHPADVTLSERVLFEHRIVDRAINTMDLIHVIYKEERSRFPSNVSIRTFSSVKSILYRYRAKHKPPLQKDVIDATLRAYQFQSCLFKDSVTVDGEAALIFIAEPPIREKFCKSHSCILYRTYKMAPKPFDQLISIHCIYANVAFPGIYVLMSTGKKPTIYEAIFTKLKENMPEWKPELFITDYEASLLSAVKNQFPNASRQDCWFHYCQDLNHKIQNIGLERLFHWNIHVKKIVGMAMVLPLLPAAKIAEGLAKIRETAEENSVSVLLNSFFEYIKNFWIENIGPEKMSNFGSNRIITNNIESFHNILRVKFRVKPNFYVFLYKLQKLNVEFQAKMKCIDDGSYEDRRSNFALIQDRKINKLSLTLTADNDIQVFLNFASHLTPNFDNRYEDLNDADCVPQKPCPSTSAGTCNPSTDVDFDDISSSEDENSLNPCPSSSAPTCNLLTAVDFDDISSSENENSQKDISSSEDENSKNVNPNLCASPTATVDYFLEVKTENTADVDILPVEPEWRNAIIKNEDGVSVANDNPEDNKAESMASNMDQINPSPCSSAATCNLSTTVDFDDISSSEDEMSQNPNLGNDASATVDYFLDISSDDEKFPQNPFEVRTKKTVAEENFPAETDWRNAIFTSEDITMSEDNDNPEENQAELMESDINQTNHHPSTNDLVTTTNFLDISSEDEELPQDFTLRRTGKRKNSNLTSIRNVRRHMDVSSSEEQTTERNICDLSSEEEELGQNMSDVSSEEEHDGGNMCDVSSEEETGRNFCDLSLEDEELDSNICDVSSEEEESERNFTDVSSEEEETEQNIYDISSSEDENFKNVNHNLGTSASTTVDYFLDISSGDEELPQNDIQLPRTEKRKP